MDTEISLKTLGKNINRVITNSKYKQADIADMLDVDRSTISRWISGERTPTAKNLIELAKVLKIEIIEFWQNVETAELPAVYKEVLPLLNKLTEQQRITVLEVIKSMLPPPELEDFLNEISNLSEVKRRALLTFVNTKND